MSRFRRIFEMIFDGRGEPPWPAARPDPSQWRDDGITGCVLGHATVLINFLGVWLLTDPVFSTRVGPGIPPLVLGPKRYLAPALRAGEVPTPDVIVQSHAHFDHLDQWSHRQFPRRTPTITAARTGDLFRGSRAREHVHQLPWGESTTVETRAGAIRFTALEVAHWGARMMRDDDRGYNGYLIERGGHAICFAGDTAYTSAFRRLRNPARPIDLMLVPIGAYDPWIRAHCTPEQAVSMANDAGARTIVPIHHETFKLSSEPMDEPITRLRTALAMEPQRLLAAHVGETFSVPLGDRI